MRTTCILLLLAACDGGGTTAATTGGGTTAATTGGGTTGSPGGPTILDLSANVSTLQPGDSLVVTAVVTHPDGISQVVGGKLADPNGGTYGAFQVSTVGGAWSITLTWDALTQVQPVADGTSTETRTFTATFYDQHGNTTGRDLQIVIACPTGEKTCDARCSALDTLTQCGGCSNDCHALQSQLPGGQLECAGGQCAAITPQPALTCNGMCTINTCEQDCATAGLHCVEDGKNNLALYGTSKVPIACSTQPDPMYMNQMLSKLQCACG